MIWAVYYHEEYFIPNEITGATFQGYDKHLFYRVLPNRKNKAGIAPNHEGKGG